jgi:hypothetical protein
MFFPAVFSSSGQIPPATLAGLFCWLIVGLTFNVFIKSRYFGWWTRYTYVLSGALDIGSALCLTLYALGIGLSVSSFPSWWGVDGYTSSLDQNDAAVTRILGDGESFGPATWE